MCPLTAKLTQCSIWAAVRQNQSFQNFLSRCNFGTDFLTADNGFFVFADIPGIIQGASEGKGLGLRFLRHIERNAILLFMVPCTSESIKEEYKILLNELKSYNPELLDKKRILAITKCDLMTEPEIKKIQKKVPTDVEVIFISSLTNQNLMPLKDKIWEFLN